MNIIRDIGPLLFWACAIAAISIGIEAYNRPENEQYKKDNLMSFNFLTIMLVIMILGLLYSGFLLYSKKRPQDIYAGRQRLARMISPASPNLQARPSAPLQTLPPSYTSKLI